MDKVKVILLGFLICSLLGLLAWQRMEISRLSRLVEIEQSSREFERHAMQAILDNTMRLNREVLKMMSRTCVGGDAGTTQTDAGTPGVTQE